MLDFILIIINSQRSVIYRNNHFTVVRAVNSIPIQGNGTDLKVNTRFLYLWLLWNHIVFALI